MVNVDSATGVPYPPSVIYEGPAITTTPGEPGRAAEVKWTLDPPVVLPKAGLYAFFIQNLCDGFFNLLADDRNSYSEGILWVTTRSDVSDCHLRVSPYAYPNGDLMFTIVFCNDTTTPTRTTSWGRLKAIYR